MFNEGDKIVCRRTQHTADGNAKFLTIGQTYTVRITDDEQISLEEIDFVGADGASATFWFSSKDFELFQDLNDAWNRAMRGM